MDLAAELLLRDAAMAYVNAKQAAGDYISRADRFEGLGKAFVS